MSGGSNQSQKLCVHHYSPPQKVKEQEQLLVSQQVGRLRTTCINHPLTLSLHVYLLLPQQLLTSLQSRESSPVVSGAISECCTCNSMDSLLWVGSTSYSELVTA